MIRDLPVPADKLKPGTTPAFRPGLSKPSWYRGCQKDMLKSGITPAFRPAL